MMALESSWERQSANAMLTWATRLKTPLSSHWVAVSASRSHRKPPFDLPKADLKYHFRVFLVEIAAFSSSHSPCSLEKKAVSPGPVLLPWAATTSPGAGNDAFAAVHKL